MEENNNYKIEKRTKLINSHLSKHVPQSKFDKKKNKRVVIFICLLFVIAISVSILL